MLINSPHLVTGGQEAESAFSGSAVLSIINPLFSWC